ncbi:hypothetical protein M422DRAFT_262033 [Sphaerobolus stellatus SS14]|uniref:F-box domain-containing protein n=1 Tax=Sphaerobolus stellatus (strain SS14) TaxID=990650 RepID=A0A0C9VDY6_SPHS4|nr:hypothetical protein M422DRAFT_262033 [Sphaerobolus stellatus SS14]
MDALPAELLWEIFLLAVPIFPKNLKNVPLEVGIMDSWSIISQDPLPAVHRLSSVCTLWSDIINDLPPAWSKIVNEQLDLLINCNTEQTSHEATDDVKE